MKQRNDNEFKTALKEFVLKNKEGFTIDLNLKPKKFKVGYYVGITNNSNSDLNLLINNLLRLLKGFTEEEKTGLYVGGWFDSKTNLYYLDLSVYVLNKFIAFSIAQNYKQKAVFNTKTLNSDYL